MTDQPALTDAAPRTEAGRRLLPFWEYIGEERLLEAILAIEAEAAGPQEGPITDQNGDELEHGEPDYPGQEDAVTGLDALARIAEVLDQSGGDRYAIEARAIARAALASATAPSGPDVCSYCGVPITEHPLTDACAFGG